MFWFDPSIAAALTSNPITASPDVGPLVLQGQAPMVLIGNRVSVGVASIVIDGFAASVSLPVVVPPNANNASLVLTGRAPSILNPNSATPGLGQLSLTSFAPIVQASTAARDPYGWFPGDPHTIPGRMPGKRYEEYAYEEQETPEAEEPWTPQPFHVAPSTWKPETPAWQPGPVRQPERFQSWRASAERLKAMQMQPRNPMTGNGWAKANEYQQSKAQRQAQYFEAARRRRLTLTGAS